MVAHWHHGSFITVAAPARYSVAPLPRAGTPARSRRPAMLAGALALLFLALALAMSGKWGKWGESLEPLERRWRQPLVVEWPAQKLVYVADGHRLRVFRLGLGLAPLADVALPAGHTLVRLELAADTGRLTLVLADGTQLMDGRTLKPLP